ncbi:MAG TPA: ATP-binding cassette domain-containing protein, partial [Steroidobacteraceae bacterium]
MSEPLLQLERLSVRYALRRGWFTRAASLPALEDVSLELRAGEALGIVGESGSGKSTLARAVLRLVRAHSGRIVWLGRELQGLSARQLRPLRRELQMVFQDPLASLDPRMTIGQIVAEPLRVHRRELS